MSACILDQISLFCLTLPSGSTEFGPALRDSKVFGTPTPWPEEKLVPGYRENMNQYHAQLRGLAMRLLSLMALSLGLPADHFESRFSVPVSTLRTLHYYPKTNYKEGEIGAGALTDYGGLTILLQGTGGLQVLSSARGEWVHVPPTPGLFTVNIGDMMMRWTNDRYSSTIHRVINVSNRDRFSVPFFFNLNPNPKSLTLTLLPTGRCLSFLIPIWRRE